VFIKPDIRSHPENMCAGQDTEIVQELRRCDGPKCPRCVDIRKTGVVERIGRTAGSATSVKRQNVGKRRIRFALSEQEDKAREAGREFIDDAWRDCPSIADSEILGRSKYFAQRWKSRKHLGPCVQRIASPRVLIRLQPPNKQSIPVVEGVIHTRHEVWTFSASRRIPYIAGRVQAIADNIGIWLWIRFE
jgi:hypothetical protein